MAIVIILHLKYLKKKRHINCDIDDYTIFGAFLAGPNMQNKPKVLIKMSSLLLQELLKKLNAWL